MSNKLLSNIEDGLLIIGNASAMALLNINLQEAINGDPVHMRVFAGSALLVAAGALYLHTLQDRAD